MALVLRPSIRSRNGVAYLTIRAWGSSTKCADFGVIKNVKRSVVIDADLVSAAAGEIANHVRALVGRAAGWTVSTVAVGHSRRDDAFAVQIARATASALGLEFAQVFENRFVPGVSHPKECRNLPKLQVRIRPTMPVLLVDDIVTSGFHMEEALTALRALGVAAFGVAWIGGSIKSE